MIIDEYAKMMQEGEAGHNSPRGWYYFQTTDCDTLVFGPYDTKEEAKAETVSAQQW